MEQKPTTNRVYTRRDFLKGVPLGIAGAFAAGSLAGRLFSSLSRDQGQAPAFPEDSIFRPAKDRQPHI